MVRLVRAVVRFLALTMGLTAPACGSGNPTGLPHSELVKRTDAACVTLDQTMSKVEEPQNARGYTEFVRATHDAVKRTSAELAALEPRDADAAAYDRLSSIFGDLEQTLAHLVEAARAQEPHRIEELSSKVDRLVTSSHRAARDLGARSCTR
jgi:hypothetical protein